MYAAVWPLGPCDAAVRPHTTLSHPPPPPHAPLLHTSRPAAPEVLYGWRGYDPCAIDMWSAGVTLAEMITLRPLLPGSCDLEQLALVHALLGCPVPPEAPPAVHQRMVQPPLDPVYHQAGAAGQDAGRADLLLHGDGAPVRGRSCGGSPCRCSSPVNQWPVSGHAAPRGHRIGVAKTIRFTRASVCKLTLSTRRSAIIPQTRRCICSPSRSCQITTRSRLLLHVLNAAARRPSQSGCLRSQPTLCRPGPRRCSPACFAGTPRRGFRPQRRCHTFLCWRVEMMGSSGRRDDAL